MAELPIAVRYVPIHFQRTFETAPVQPAGPRERSRLLSASLEVNVILLLPNTGEAKRVIGMNQNTSAQRHPIDMAALQRWMDAWGVGAGPLESPRLLSGGTQNLLFRFHRANQNYVLRRPPLHLRAESNEAMRREARVLAALSGTDVPHPRLIAACDDETVLGATFYIMSEIDGINATKSLNPAHLAPEAQHAMGYAMVDALAALGGVDFEAAGLQDFGKSDGYLERQVARWRRQVASYLAYDGWPGPQGLPYLSRIQDWLDENRPQQGRAGILHGDFHIANVMFEPNAPNVAAIIDWELATIGDPLVDLGWLLATWPGYDGEPMASIFTVAPWSGFPSRQELAARYAQRTARDLSALDWYVVLACYKLGIILEGTFARSCVGKADPALGQKMHHAAVALLERAARIIGART